MLYISFIKNKVEELLKTYHTFIKLTKEDTFDYDKFNEFAIVHHSNSIEGSTLTKEETFLLLEEKLTPKNKPLEHSLMAIDHLEALKYVLNLAKNKELLTVDIIKNISALLMKTTGSKISSIGGDYDSSKGDFRKNTVRAGTTTFIDYKKVPNRVYDLISYINEKNKIVNSFIEVNKLAFDSHFQMVSIHPFADGNGRLSRLLMNYVQHYHKKPLTVVYKENKLEYFKALTETRKNEDINIFRSFMFEQTKKYLLEKISDVSKKQQIKKSKENGMSFLF